MPGHRTRPGKRAAAGDAMFHANERRDRRRATIARALLLATIAAGLPFLVSPASRVMGHAVVAVLLLSGFCASIAGARVELRALSWAFVTIDAVGLAGIPLLFALPADAGASAVPIAWLFVLVAVTALDRSPGLTTWAGLAGLASWVTADAWLATRPDLPGWADIAKGVREHLAAISGFSFCTATLALDARRARLAAMRQAKTEREYANLARHFSPRVVEELTSRDPHGSLPRCQEVGVLFADMQGFTALAETMPPEQVLAMLCEFHNRMEKQAFRYGGTLEKYIGDAMLVTFGVLRPSTLDAIRALACARGMLHAIEQLSAERIASGRCPIRIGIGVHHGPVVVGEIGHERNVAFVTVGDTINTASRLQSLTRDMRCALVASDALVRTVRASLVEADPMLAGLVRVGPRAVAGRERLVDLWVLPRLDGLDPPVGGPSCSRCGCGLAHPLAPLYPRGLMQT